MSYSRRMRSSRFLVSMGLLLLVVNTQACNGGEAGVQQAVNDEPSIGEEVADEESTDQDTSDYESGAETSEEEAAQSAPVDEASGNESSDNADTDEPAAIEVDEGIFSAEVRLPLDLYGEDASNTMSADEIKQQMSAEGYDVEVDIEDQAVVLKMSRTTYEVMKSEMRSGVDELISESLADEGEIYKSVEYSEDMREFTVGVDGSVFGQSISFFGFGLMIAASFYQPFAGVSTEDRYVKITYIDQSSGEVLDTYDTRDL